MPPRYHPHAQSTNTQGDSENSSSRSSGRGEETDHNGNAPQTKERRQTGGRHRALDRETGRRRVVGRRAPAQARPPQGKQGHPQAEPPPVNPHGSETMPAWSWDALTPQLRKRLLANPINWRKTLRNDPCALCGGPGGETVHIVARSAGGHDRWNNLSGTCADCRSAKGSSSLLDRLKNTHGTRRNLISRIRIVDGLRLASCKCNTKVGDHTAGRTPVERLLEWLLAANPGADGAIIFRRRSGRTRRGGTIHHAVMLRPEAGHAGRLCAQRGGTGTRTRGSFQTYNRAGTYEKTPTETPQPAAPGNRRGGKPTHGPVSRRARVQGASAQWREIIRNDPCALCGGRGGTIDHIVPRSRGGRAECENIAGTCRRCNSKKGSTSLLMFLQQRSQPAVDAGHHIDPRPARVRCPPREPREPRRAAADHRPPRSNAPASTQPSPNYSSRRPDKPSRPDHPRTRRSRGARRTPARARTPQGHQGRPEAEPPPLKPPCADPTPDTRTDTLHQQPRPQIRSRPQPQPCASRGEDP